jgi:hypothetical protein
MMLMLAAMTYGCALSSYQERYPEACEKANHFFEKHKSEFEQASEDVGLSAEFLFAIVAPEISQVSYWSNVAETYVLKVMYVHGGSVSADFSIGAFQMKPSFIEKMEVCVAEDNDLKVIFSDCLITDSDLQPAREDRLNRMSKVEWQIKYLTLFCAVVNKRFGAIAFADEEEKLRFYASAYNCGFHKSEQQIRAIEKKALFPHYVRQKFIYSDVALWFYKNC